MIARLDEHRDIALVVDDSPESLSMLTDALEESGVTVLVARDGPSALTLGNRVSPDVILLDAIMPEMDGFETCRRMKTGFACDIPVIFMTALSEPEHVVTGLKAGGVDYLTKPINTDELIARIGIHVGNARLISGARQALDATGRSVVAVEPNGTVVWASPRVADLLPTTADNGRDHARITNTSLLDWIAKCTKKPVSATDPHVIEDARGQRLELSYLGRSGLENALIGVSIADQRLPAEQLMGGLGLTRREAEVLHWLCQGKSTRDIASILELSPRTVNKHLEQIFTKLGVENRTAAAAIGIRALASLR